MWKYHLTTALTLMSIACFAGESKSAAPAAAYAQWITEMKAAPRGPFRRIRWFCQDGQVLPPKSYACAEFGGGSQHGEWSERTVALRKAGYLVANVISDLDLDALLVNDQTSERLAQMLIEQFLLRVDDGWILRKARFYRGAFQEEGERRGARKLLFKMAEDHDWLGYRFLALRTAARFLRHGQESASIQEVRQLSASLADRDPKFKTVRNKIHGSPEPSDATRVRNFLNANNSGVLATDFERLALLIDEVYASDINAHLGSLAKASANTSDIAAMVSRATTALNAASEPQDRFRMLATLLHDLRQRLTVPNGPRVRMHMIDTSLVIESELFSVAAHLDTTAKKSRREQLAMLRDHLRALYGVGLISKRQLGASVTEITRLLATPAINVQQYKRTLDYLALVPNWGTQNLRRFFGAAMDRLYRIEPKAALYIQDQLRGSPMFSYATLIDRLVRDANDQAGVRNELFGTNAGAGLRSLNPGLARGNLRLAISENIADLDTDGIYLLPETVSELPPVAGILTAGEGNPLSHVQLLARNLGIPNVGIDHSQIGKLEKHEGARVVLAVSPSGSVRLNLDNGSTADSFNIDEADDEPKLIQVDLLKLNLAERQFYSLSELRAADSGRIVGPKAAKLGELKRHYPQAVAEGLAIPFGIFKDILDQSFEGGTSTIFLWMQAQYERIAALPEGSVERRQETAAFRAKLQATIREADPGNEFRQRLRTKLTQTFGPDNTFGVFVRSDTNVEDLLGFTGAGLNLTVANVVGIDNILAAISQVWASPFSARSFAWRQTLMDKPEHVYPAVLLMLSVDADKSGVLVTQDINTGNPSWISVAVNEGIGGAVDGQSAESLRIDTASGTTRLMAASTAAVRRQVDVTGGIKKLPVTTSDRVLSAPEIKQLIVLAKQLPNRFPAILDAAGKSAPADIEFGFLDGELRLFQIRPFLDSDNARNYELLRELDAPLAARAANVVSLDEIP